MIDLSELARDLFSFLPLPGPGAPNAHDVYLSPHCDDVCFSLISHIMQRWSAGVLLTVFTRSNCINNGEQIVAGGFDELPLAERIARVSEVRRREDERFAAMAGLTRINCGLDEAPVRGREPFDASFAREDTRRFAATIMDKIRSMTVLPVGHSPGLYCPMGIGGHVDHLVVRNAVLENLVELRGLYAVNFYEDLPYASNPAARRAGLQDFFAQVSPWKPRRKAIRVAAHDHKTSKLEIYASQFSSPPSLRQAFTPATNVPFHPMHEALWLI